MSAPLALRQQPAGQHTVALIARPEVYASSRPLVAMLHGALRHAGALTHWVDPLHPEADVVLIELPGHGYSPPIIPASVALMARAVSDALHAAFANRRILLVGESLGGLVALAMAGEADAGGIGAVVACDPPMTTAKLWNVKREFDRIAANGSSTDFLQSLGEEAFGVGQNGVTERIYYPLLDALRCPAIIATGDIPLLPPRVVTTAPCLFDAVDQYIVTRFYPAAVRLCRIADCGHLLLTDAVEQCHRIIREALHQYVVPLPLVAGETP